MKKLLSIALGLGLLLASTVYAQFADPVRPIPANAPKAKMLIAGERTLNLNGKDFMLAPGGVILNEKNLSVLTTALNNGDTYSVRVKFNNQVQVQHVWILTPAENEVDAPKLAGDSSFWHWLFPWL